MRGPDRENRLVAVTLDADSIGGGSPELEHERAVAIRDLVAENRFVLSGQSGPYRLVLSLFDKRLVFDVRSTKDVPLMAHALSLTPFRRVVRDYFIVCESYSQAILSGTATRIEALDMGRRGLHNEGSEILMQRLAGKIEIDFDTARRLFTLVSVLHRRG